MISGTILLVIIVGMVYTFRIAHKSPSVVEKGYDAEMRSLMICKTLPQDGSSMSEQYEIYAYQNGAGEIAGFTAVSNLEGGATYYYDKMGSLILKLGTRPPDQEEVKKLDLWNGSTKEYPIKKVYPCSKAIN